MTRVAGIGVLAALLGVIVAAPAVAARGTLAVKVQVNSPAAFRNPAVLHRVNRTGHRARYYVTTTGWTGGRTLNPRHVTVTIKLARGEGAIYVGTLAHLPHAGPLFAGSRPPGGSITVHVFATVPHASDLHGHARTITLAISLSPARAPAVRAAMRRSAIVARTAPIVLERAFPCTLGASRSAPGIVPVWAATTAG
jgi:hypothetical protein